MNERYVTPDRPDATSIVPHLASLATAVPDHRYGQDEIFRTLIPRGFTALQQRLARRVFHSSGVAYRHTVIDLSEPIETMSTAALNDRYVLEAVDLGERAARAALDTSGVAPEGIDELVFVSSSGIDLPSLDLRLAARLGLRPDVRRLSVLGMGCNAAVPGLVRAYQSAQSPPGRNVLTVALEISSLHYQVNEALENVVVSALFADGAAATVISPRLACGPVLVDTATQCTTTDPRFGRWRLSEFSRPDALEIVARGEGVIVSENFVHNLGQGLGDELTLPTPSGAARLPIVGVTVDFLSPRGSVNLSREVYARLWRDDQIVRALVAIDAGADASEVRRRITASLGPRLRLRVLTIPALMDWFADQVGRAFAALYALAGLVLVIVAAGVGDALAAGIVERTRDFGTARALGASRVTLTRLVLTESVLVGLVGLAITWSVGLALGALWVASVFPALVGWTLRFDVPLTALLVVGGGALATCVIAAYAPARRAARIEPARALRAE